MVQYKIGAVMLTADSAVDGNIQQPESDNDWFNLRRQKSNRLMQTYETRTIESAFLSLLTFNPRVSAQ
jgi:hypothetical protein